MRQLLQTMTETINTLFPVVNHKMCYYWSLVFNCCCKTLTFHKVVQCTFAGVVGSLVIVLLQVFYWFCVKSLKIGQYLMEL